MCLVSRTRFQPQNDLKHLNMAQSAGERHNLRATLGIAAEEELKQQFLAFANFGIHTGVVSDMDGAHWAKYCTDCKLVGKGSGSFGSKALTLTDVDLTFAKVKSKGARRITFDQFLKALGLLAEKQAASIAEVVAHCLRFVAPANNAKAVAEDVRLHDDKVSRTLQSAQISTRATFVLYGCPPVTISL
jgi:hypothetical protein